MHWSPKFHQIKKLLLAFWWQQINLLRCMCECVCVWWGFFQFRKNLCFLLWLDCICHLLWAVSLGFLEEFLLFPNKTMGYKTPLWEKILKSTLLHKEKAVVKRCESRSFRLFPGAVGFGDKLSHSGVRRNGSSDPEQKWKEILKGFCLGEGKGGQGSDCQKRKDLCLLIYSLLGMAGSLRR